MTTFPLTTFRKTRQCPSAQALLAYDSAHVERGIATDVKSHLAYCEFCSAEIQLLHRHHAQLEEYIFVEMPEHLRRLAEDLLRPDAFPVSRLISLARN